MFGPARNHDTPRRAACAAASRRWCATAFAIILLAVLLTLGIGSPVAAQDAWQMTPYRMYAAVIFEPSPALTEHVQEELLRDLSEQCDNVLGGNWDLTVAAAAPNWASAASPGLRNPNLDLIVKNALTLQDERSAAGIVDPIDKIFLIHISFPDTGWRVAVREFDVVTRILGDIVVLEVPQFAVVGQAVFDAVLTAFAPLAKIEESDTDDIRLGLRAEGLPRRDPNLHFTVPGDLFVPVIRQNNRDGSPRGIRAVPWTYLRVNSNEPEVDEVGEEGEGADATPAAKPTPAKDSGADDADSQNPTIVNTTIFSALQSAFSKRRRGREEKYALGVRVPYETTIFKAVDRSAPTKALEGYEVISYTPDSPVTTRLGQTNSLGEVVLTSDDSPLHLLLIRSGDRMLARLPIVPGSQKVAEIELPDDSERLKVEGFIAGVQEELVAIFTQRELLMRRIANRLENNQIEEAKEIMVQLRQLPTAESYRTRIESQKTRSRIRTTDAYVQQNVTKLFDDTLRVLDRYFKTDAVRELQQRIDIAASN